MFFSLPDIAGAAGAALVVLAYFLLQTRRLQASAILHQVMNGAGAALILYSLYFKPNLGAVVVEIFWLAISLFALLRELRERRRSAPPATGIKRPF